MKTGKFIAALLSFAVMCSSPAYLLSRGNAVHGGGQTAYAYNEGAENPYNKQDDKMVKYDGSKYVQPPYWNEPHIDPRDYDGGVMLFFDMIGLEPEYAKGKVQRVYFSAVGIEEPVNMARFHMFYDTRLKVKPNSDGKPVTNGTLLKDFTTDSVLIEEGQIEYYAYSETAAYEKGSIFTVDFIVPEDAQPGDVYPFGIVFVEDEVGPDLFINKAQDAAGRLQMTYVFTKGMYSGYIKIIGEKPTTTTTSTTAPATTTTAPPKPENKLGDPNFDGKIDSNDATFCLVEYAKLATGGKSTLTEQAKSAADVNRDKAVDSKDSSAILSYYSYKATGGKDGIEDFLTPKAT